jgi:hypothetical protein
VSDLNSCDSLEYIRLDSFPKAEGLGDLVIPNLKGAYLTQLQTNQFIDAHSQLSWLRVKKYTGEVTEAMIDRGWEKSYGELGFGGPEIPKTLRG